MKPVLSDAFDRAKRHMYSMCMLASERFNMCHALVIVVCTLTCWLCVCMHMCGYMCLYSSNDQMSTITDVSVGIDFEKSVKLIKLQLLKVQFSTAQHCWDHTEAAGRWRDRSLLPQQTPQGKVYLRERERERDTD